MQRTRRDCEKSHRVLCYEYCDKRKFKVLSCSKKLTTPCSRDQLGFTGLFIFCGSAFFTKFVQQMHEKFALRFVNCSF